MLSILSGILGFATSGLPSVLKFFENKSDQKHEREMAQLQMERELALAEKGWASQERIEDIRTDQIEMQTYTQERVALYEHDARLQEKASGWVVNLSASVRPVVTYCFVFLLLFTDIAGMVWAIKTGVDFTTALTLIFSDEEMAIVASIIGFWFGSRHWDKKR